jgi:hypothetical protein
MRHSRFAFFVAACALLVVSGCDSEALNQEETETRVAHSDPEAFFNSILGENRLIWQNEDVFPDGDYTHFTRSSLIVFPRADVFAGSDGCKMFSAYMEFLGDGRVAITGEGNPSSCPGGGGFDLSPDTFHVYVDGFSVDFVSPTKTIAIRSIYTEDMTESPLIGTWKRFKYIHEPIGRETLDTLATVSFNTQRQLDIRSYCISNFPNCRIRTGSFWGLGKERFMTYVFPESTPHRDMRPVDEDIKWTSEYSVHGDTLELFSSRQKLRHFFTRID